MKWRSHWLLVRSYLPCLRLSSPRDGSIRDDHVRPPTWRCRSCFGEMILARTIARHLRNYKHTDIRTYIFLVAPQTPFPELGLQPSDKHCSGMAEPRVVTFYLFSLFFIIYNITTCYYLIYLFFFV